MQKFQHFIKTIINNPKIIPIQDIYIITYAFAYNEPYQMYIQQYYNW